jgi:hypothetical protein
MYVQNDATNILHVLISMSEAMVACILINI